jgi:peroxiredoxin Q/BCP
MPSSGRLSSGKPKKRLTLTREKPAFGGSKFRRCASKAPNASVQEETMSALNIGDPAPPFLTLAVGGSFGEGKQVSLAEFAGQTVVLYFYPKDDTPGCTTQACGLRDAWHQFEKKAVVFGVSVDSSSKHQKFIAKYSLPFPLLSDEDQKVVNAYGVWVKKSMYGKEYMGTERSTFVIGHDGKIKGILHKVKPAEHAEALMALL